jgi:hypothetical protein
MPQLPPPHAEAPQPAAGAPQLMEGPDPEAEETAKVEICFSTVVLEHDGQEAASPQRRISFSNSWAHSAQRYSYMGMVDHLVIA